MNIFALLDGAEFRKLRIEKRFAPRKNDPTNAQGPNRVEMTREIVGAKRTMIFCFPNVTHDAAAVARAMRVNYKNGEMRDSMSTEIARSKTTALDGDEISCCAHSLLSVRPI